MPYLPYSQRGRTSILIFRNLVAGRSASRTCMGVAVVGIKNELPTSKRSHRIKYSTPYRVSTRMLSAKTGFGLDGGGVFRLRERRLVDANCVSIKNVAAHCDTTKPPYGSRADSGWV